MLNWSNTTYKFTLGIGGLAITGMMAELWQKALPFWGILIIAVTPLALFVFANPNDMPVRFARIAHAVGAIWYMIAAFGALFALVFTAKPLPQGWPVYPLFVLVGAVPCGVVLYRMAKGTYLPKPKMKYEIIAPLTDNETLFLREVSPNDSPQPYDDGNRPP
jgi:hypothetical protein